MMNRRRRVELNLRAIPELQKIVLPNVQPTGQELGRGAFGTVEEVEIPGATCAAKRIHESLLRLGTVEDAKSIADAFVRECLLMSTLHHPHIVQFLGVCFLPGSQLPLLVMEQLTMSLDDLLETNSHVSLTTKCSILNDIVNGLTYLHSHTPPIIHRDLTAKNVLLNSAMVAKLADLGVARIMNIQPGQLASTMTQAPGTLVYMPPEALEPNAKYNAKLDIFSFGVLSLYTLMQIFPVLKAPTYIDSDGRIAARSEIDRRIDYIEKIHHEFGRHHPLVLMIKQCLHDDPRQRPTLDEVLQRLDEAKIKLAHHDEQLSRPELEQAVVDKEQALREKEGVLKAKEEVLRAKEEEIAQLQQQVGIVCKVLHIDGFKKPIKHPTSGWGRQVHDQEVAVQRTFHLVRSSCFYLSALMVRTQHKLSLSCLYFAHNCAKHRPRLFLSGSETSPHENYL